MISLGLGGPGAVAEVKPTSQRQRQREMLELLEERWQQACNELNQGRQSIGLAEAIRTGLLNNPILTEQYASVQASQWQARAIRREWSPTLTGNNPNPEAIAIRQDRLSTDSRTDINTQQSTSEKLTNSFYSSPRLQLNWTFLDPTRTPRLKSSLANERSRQLLFDISARNLILEIQGSYYRLQEARELREDYNRIYELTRKQVVRAIQLRKAGAGTQGDVDQLRAQLFQQLVQLIQIYEQEVIAANQLAYTLSLEPGQLLLPSEKLRPSGTWELALQTTIEEALALREEIKSSLARAEQYGWSAKARLNSYLPSVSILGQSQLNTNNQLDQTVGSTGWSETITRGVRNDLGLTFKWLMFDGGVTVAESQALREQANSAKAQAANDRLEVTLQVQNSYATYNSSNMVIDTSQEQLREARKSVEYTASVYNGSTIAATVFIQNIQSYLNASQAYKSSVRRFNTALAALYRYSARWPEGSTADLNQRLIKLSGS